MYHWWHHWHHRSVVTPPPPCPCWLGIVSTPPGWSPRAPAPSWPPTLACSEVPGQKIHKEICSSFHIMQYSIEPWKRLSCRFSIFQFFAIFQNIIWRYLSDNDVEVVAVVVDVAASFLPRAELSPLPYISGTDNMKQEKFIHYYFGDTESLHKY